MKFKLRSNLKEMVGKERELLIQILHDLREVDENKFYLEWGYPSLFAYMTEELGYSEGAAQRRIQAMRLIKDIPQVEEKLESGKLSLSVAAQIQGFIRKEDFSKSEKLDLVEQLEGTSARECEKKLIAISPTTALPKEKTRILTEEKALIQFIADKEMMQDMEKLKFLMAHQNYEGRYDQLFKQIMKMALKQLDPGQKIARRKEKTKTSLSPTSAVRTRHIPQKIRDQIWLRDQGKCQYQDATTGKICNSQYTIQIDHKKPYALGGSHEPGNLQLLCGAHNRHRAKEMFG